MDATNFFNRILPAEGLYFCAIPAKSTKGFKHYAATSIEQLEAYCRRYDEQGFTVYFATAAFKEERVLDDSGGKRKYRQRVQSNVRALKSFWLDLDVGADDGKHYPSQGEAIKSLFSFIKETGLPNPIIVNSGSGVHVYWPLETEVLPAQWKMTAQKLKDLAEGLNMLADPARTADSASVLRPPGSHNRKAGSARKVSVLEASSKVPNTSYAEFNKIVDRALKSHNITSNKPKPTTISEAVNAGAGDVKTYLPSYAEDIASKCAQMGEFYQKRGNLPEPIWYNGIQLLNYVVDGEKYIHEWSKGYEKYSKEETASKAERAKEHGPTTCDTFQKNNKDGCAGCPYAGKIRSPISLGIRLKQAEPVTIQYVTDEGVKDITLPPPPAPFKRGGEGMEGIYIDVDGAPIQIYEHDIYPTEIEKDLYTKEAFIKMKHYLPKEGWGEFSFKRGDLYDIKKFNTAFANEHIHIPTSGKLTTAMREYVASYIEKLQKEVKVSEKHDQFGWKEDDKGKVKGFLLGDTMYRKGDTPVPAGLSSQVTDGAKAVVKRGELESWVKLTASLNKPGWEQHKFALCIAFAAPLLRFTNLHGGMINVTGLTGGGKTAIANMMLSVYGSPSETMSTTNSTPRARENKLSLYNNLPLYIDEMTMLEPKELGELAYAIANGAGRDRLYRTGTMLPVRRWNTIVLTSSNASLHDKLTTLGENTEAQRMRVFEYYAPQMGDDFSKWVTDEMWPVLEKNFGTAGHVYIEKLVQMDHEELSKTLKRVMRELSEWAGATGQHRFWIGPLACVMYGAVMAKQLGLIRFDLEDMNKWIVSRIKEALDTESHASTPFNELLAQWLREHAGGRLSVTGRMTDPAEANGLPGKLVISSHSRPEGVNASVSHRVWPAEGQVAIPQGALKLWLIHKGVNFREFKQQLIKEGQLLWDGNPKRLDLGYGFPKFEGKRERCLIFALRPQLQLVKGHPAQNAADIEDKIDPVDMGG